MIPFAVYTTTEIPMHFYGPDHPKISHSHGDFKPHLTHGSLDSRKSVPKQHLDRFSRFCAAQRNKQTEHDTFNIDWNRPHLCDIA